MNSSSTSEDSSVCRNWNTSPPFVGLDTSTQNHKQLWDWDDASSSHQQQTALTGTNCYGPILIPVTAAESFPHFSPSAYQNVPQHPSDPSEVNGRLIPNGGRFGPVGSSRHGSARIGLNLGQRIYFSSRETTVIDRLFRRSRGFCPANQQIPRCQVEGCNEDLTNAKHYHRRHRVCERHSKANKVLLAGGMEQRFCQQCSRFHCLAEFDEEKRSCRKRLADHNRRRRKSHPGTTPDSGADGASNTSTGIKNPQAEDKITASPSLPLLITKGIQSSNPEELRAPQLAEGPALSLIAGANAVPRRPQSQFTRNAQEKFRFSPNFSSFSIDQPASFYSCSSVTADNGYLLSQALQPTSGEGSFLQTHLQQPGEGLQNLLLLRRQAMFKESHLP